MAYKNKVVFVLFIITIIIAMHADFNTALSVSEEMGINEVLSVNSLKKPPVLSADTTQNAVRMQIEISFEDDEEWRKAIKEVQIDGVPLDNAKYQKDTKGKIIIDKSVFKASKDYAVKIKSDGYADAELKQRIGLFCITGNGVADEIVFTREELEKFNQKKMVFSAVNDFPEYLLVTVEGIPLRLLLEKAGVNRDAKKILFRGSDGYIGEYILDELLNQDRYFFPDKTKTEPIIALKRIERCTDFSKMNEQDTPVLCFGQRAETEQTLLGFVKTINYIEVTSDMPEKWDKPVAKIINHDTGQKTEITGGIVESGSEIILTGSPKTKVYYTLDGTEPTLNSPIFNKHGCGPMAGSQEPIIINKDTVIKAKAVWNGKSDSDTACFSFKINNSKTDLQPKWLMLIFKITGLNIKR